MKVYADMTADERQEEYAGLEISYKECKEKGLKLNMARGKPSAEQVELSVPMLDSINSTSDCITNNGIDCRNYGELTGIGEAKELFSQYMGVSTSEIIIMGSASLNIMYDCMSRAMLTGVMGSSKPWSKYDKVKFLCPVPGYDRHFAICEFLGIEMISVPTNEEGPDMDMVESLVAEDETIKGMWCVPKFSNPLGITYSDATIRRLAALRPKAKDFRIFYDNAYAMHYVYDNPSLLNIMDVCKEMGTSDMLYMFGSTNKITFPGSGVSFFAASRANIEFTVKQLGMQAIGWDKLNMLRHVRFLKDMDTIACHMDKHASMLKPRFDVVISSLEQELETRKIGTFHKPGGGYFVTYQAPENCAGRIAELCREAGVMLTPAGSTHPYMSDPADSFIRIAPSFPSVKELQSAMEIFCIAARMAALENFRV